MPLSKLNLFFVSLVSLAAVPFSSASAAPPENVTKDKKLQLTAAKLLDCALNRRDSAGSLYGSRRVLQEYMDSGSKESALSILEEMKSRFEKMKEGERKGEILTDNSLHIAFLQIADSLLDLGETGQALKWINEEEESEQRRWSRDDWPARIFKRIALQLADQEKWDEAIETAKKATYIVLVPDPSSSNNKRVRGHASNHYVLEAYSEIAQAAFLKGQRERALGLVSEIGCDNSVPAYVAFAKAEKNSEAAKGWLKKANEKLETKACIDWGAPIWGLLAVARGYAELGERKEAALFRKRAFDSIEKLSPPSEKAWPLLDLARTTLESGEGEAAKEFLERAFQAGQELDSKKLSDKLHFLMETTASMAQASGIQRASEMADKIGDEYYSNKARKRIVEALLSKGKVKEAEEFSKRVTYADHFVDAMIALLRFYGQAKDTERAQATAQKALQAATKSHNTENHLTDLAHEIRVNGLDGKLEAEGFPELCNPDPNSRSRP